MGSFPTPMTSQTGQFKTILIVEDAASDRQIFRRYWAEVEDYVFRFIEVDTLETGLAWLRTEQPDLISLNLVLADGNSLEFLTAMHQEQAGEDSIPVIILVERKDKQRLVQAIKLDTVDFLKKDKITAIAPLVLLVEDNEANIQTFSAYRTAIHYQIVVVRNGGEAVAMAKAHAPDIILMDIQIPTMDGLEAIRLIRADPQTAAIPIVAL